MKRRFITLVAAVALSIKPFMLGSLASGLGLTDSGGFLSAFLRYLIAPQAIAAVCLFFLWYDAGKYDAFKPLAILMQALSLVTAVACVFAASGDMARLFVRAGDLYSFVQRAGVVVAIDLGGLLAAITAHRPARALPGESPKES
ncbi:MAG: hypothetical protein ABFC75_00945 [Rectinema sp.]